MPIIKQFQLDKLIADASRKIPTYSEQGKISFKQFIDKCPMQPKNQTLFYYQVSYTEKTYIEKTFHEETYMRAVDRCSFNLPDRDDMYFNSEVERTETVSNYTFYLNLSTLLIQNGSFNK